MSAQVRDMTKGSPAKLILLFAVPLMLGNIFQQWSFYRCYAGILNPDLAALWGKEME